MTLFMSPARAHRARVLAALAVSASTVGDEIVGGVYELMLAQLVQHKRQLKTIQSIERKIDAKRNFLPVYQEWVDAVIANGIGAQDQVLMTVLVWMIDVGDFGNALKVARYAMTHELSMPDQYERNLATVLLDEIGGAALVGKLPLEQCVQVLEEVLALTADSDTPDPARAKVHKALGYALMGRVATSEIDVSILPIDATKRALKHCRRAFELFEQIGVKKDLERLERRLKAADELDA